MTGIRVASFLEPLSLLWAGSQGNLWVELILSYSSSTLKTELGQGTDSWRQRKLHTIFMLYLGKWRPRKADMTCPSQVREETNLTSTSFAWCSSHQYTPKREYLTQLSSLNSGNKARLREREAINLEIKSMMSNGLKRWGPKTDEGGGRRVGRNSSGNFLKNRWKSLKKSVAVSSVTVEKLKDRQYAGRCWREDTFRSGLRRSGISRESGWWTAQPKGGKHPWLDFFNFNFLFWPNFIFIVKMKE